MDKLAIGPGFAPDTVTLDMSPSERIEAWQKQRMFSKRTQAFLTVRATKKWWTNCAKQFPFAITDGDVAGVMHCAEPDITGIDIYMDQVAPPGVLAASALKCMGGQIYGRLLFRNDDERARAASAGITDLNRIYTRDDMVKGDVIFAATGVTSGSLLPGIKREVGYFTTETVLMRSKTGSVRRMSYRTPKNRAAD